MDLRPASVQRSAGRAWLAILGSLAMVDTVTGLTINYCSSQNTGASFQGGQLWMTCPNRLQLLMALQSRTITSRTGHAKKPVTRMPLRLSRENSAGAPTMRPAFKARRAAAIPTAPASHTSSAETQTRISSRTSRLAATSRAHSSCHQRRRPRRLVSPSGVHISLKYHFPRHELLVFCLSAGLDITSCASLS